MEAIISCWDDDDDDEEEEEEEVVMAVLAVPSTPSLLLLEVLFDMMAILTFMDGVLFSTNI